MAKNEELLTYLDSCSLFRLQLLNEFEIILSLIEDDSNTLKNIRETYGLLEKSTFNIFEPIKKYWLENFHEIILLHILNPKTKEIGKLEYLHMGTSKNPLKKDSKNDSLKT